MATTYAMMHVPSERVDIEAEPFATWIGSPSVWRSSAFGKVSIRSAQRLGVATRVA
jgi:hypothetical protein